MGNLAFPENKAPVFQYIHNLGVPSDWEFVDVYGMDPDLLMMVPRPVAAVMLLYPITEKVLVNR